MIELAPWQAFYGFIGGSAAALIGLQFVVIALVSEAPWANKLGSSATAFATPTIVHFSTSMLVAGVLVAPWPAAHAPGLLCAFAGLAGIAYVALSAVRALRQDVYRPDVDDWVYYFFLPLAAYVTLAASGYATAVGHPHGLFGVGGSALALLFVGIRNAWDSITYHIFVQRPAHSERRRE